MTAYYLDRAVTYFGKSLEAELDSIERDGKDPKMIKHKKQLTLDKWLQREDEGKPTTKRFKDPMAM